MKLLYAYLLSAMSFFAFNGDGPEDPLRFILKFKLTQNNQKVSISYHTNGSVRNFPVPTNESEILEKRKQIKTQTPSRGLTIHEFSDYLTNLGNTANHTITIYVDGIHESTFYCNQNENTLEILLINRGVINDAIFSTQKELRDTRLILHKRCYRFDIYINHKFAKSFTIFK